MSVRKVLKLVRCNDDGRVIGEDHPRAYLTDAEVDMIRDMHDSGMGYKSIAKRMTEIKGRRVPKATVCKICRYEVRAQTFWLTRSVRVVARLDVREVEDGEG